jgi:hypothetical protein
MVQWTILSSPEEVAVVDMVVEFLALVAVLEDIVLMFLDKHPVVVHLQNLKLGISLQALIQLLLVEEVMVDLVAARAVE